MRTLTVAAVVALMVSTAAVGQSIMTYELKLGGDSHVADWEAYNNPAYTPGTLTDGAVIDCAVVDCSALTWDATVAVSGLHSSDSFDTNGATCLVFDVELQDSGAAVVDAVTFYSEINDGDADGLRGTIEGPDPLEMAAFCLIFGQDANSAIAGAGPPAAPGRAFDDDASGGPYMRRAQFPTVGAHGGGRLDQAGNHVAGGTPAAGLSNGKLIGMGCGYPQFNAVDNGGPATAGVGIDPWEFNPSSFSCERGLGILPVVEGQMDASAIGNGDFTLVLTPGAGNNIMPGSYDCQFGAAVAFAEAADQVDGDSLAFTLINNDGGCGNPVAQTWWSVVNHGVTLGDLRIDLEEAPATSGDVTTESRALASDGGAGSAMLIEVDFDSDITACLAGDATVTGGATVSSQALINGGTTLQINLAGVADQVCYSIDLSTAVNNLTGVVSCSVATLNGDSNDDQVVSSFDRAEIKAAGGTPVTIANARVDVNSDGVNSSFDRALVKSASGGSVTCP